MRQRRAEPQTTEGQQRRDQMKNGMSTYRETDWKSESPPNATVDGHNVSF